jgi:hypothetical protein
MRPSETKLEMLIFMKGGKPENTKKKPLKQGIERTNKQLDSQTPCPGLISGPQW